MKSCINSPQVNKFILADYTHWVVYLIITIFCSCTNLVSDIPAEVQQILKFAGPNKSELQKVIDHYKGKDEEKLQAAFFLISNLHGQAAITGHDIYEPAFKHAKAIITESKDRNLGVVKLNNLIDSVKLYGLGSLALQPDLPNIRAEFLIENIEMAFEAYNKLPENFRSNKELFIKYVLPYRVSNEPIEPGLRKKLFKDFYWAYEHLEKYGSLKSTICAVLDSANVPGGIKYPSLLPVSKVYEFGAQECLDRVNLSVSVLRSLGIPSVCDFGWWGNIPNANHQWIVLYIGDESYAVEPSRDYLNPIYKTANFPKIYRRTYEVDPTSHLFYPSQDVTSFYRETSNLQLEIGSKIEKAHLSTFKRQQGWHSVAESENNNGMLIFNNIGRDIIYGIRNPVDEYEIFGAPFYIDLAGNLKYLNADFKNKIDVKLNRKAQPYLVHNLAKLKWIRSINGSEIQAANKKDFSDFVVLKKIEGFNSSNKQIIQINHDGKYKYYRLCGKKKEVLDLAAFHLLDNNRNIIETEWNVFAGENQIELKNGKNAVDNDPLSFISGTQAKVVYSLATPMNIKYFEVHARNDDNNIKPGDLHELLYWDKGWKSAGRQVAEDTLLFYKNIPSGTLYWLRNHSGGREENAFLIDESGLQFWPGVSTIDPQKLKGEISWALNFSKLCDYD